MLTGTVESGSRESASESATRFAWRRRAPPGYSRDGTTSSSRNVSSWHPLPHSLRSLPLSERLFVAPLNRRLRSGRHLSPSSSRFSGAHREPPESDRLGTLSRSAYRRIGRAPRCYQPNAGRALRARPQSRASSMGERERQARRRRAPAAWPPRSRAVGRGSRAVARRGGSTLAGSRLAEPRSAPPSSDHSRPRRSR